MKTNQSLIRLSFLFTVASLCFNLAHAAAINPYITGIRDFISSNNLGDLQDKHVMAGALPGRTFYAQNQKSVAAFPDGIHQFLITNTRGETYQFNALNELKNKKALLHIVIKSDVQKASIALPEIDTVIEGKNLDDFTFFLGSSQRQNNANYYFFTDINNKKSKILIKARGQIYAEKPEIFTVVDGSSTQKIIPLKHAEFFFKHTINQIAIPPHKSAILHAFDYTDDHERKARPHQIRQIIEYVIAQQQGSKYFTLEAATGSGKTNTMLRLAELLDPKKVLIVTPRLNLVEQMKNEAATFYKHLTIAEKISDDQNFTQFILSNEDKKIHIVTLQAFQQNYDKQEILSKFDAVIFDEAHNLLSTERAKMVEFLKQYDNKKLQIFFFTATPTSLYKHIQSKIKSVFELSEESRLPSPHVTPFRIFEAIDAKVNTRFQIVHITNLIKPEDRWHDVGAEFIEATVQKSISQDNYHRVVLDFYLKARIKDEQGKLTPIFGKKAITFGVGIGHAEALTTYLNSNFDSSLDDEQLKVIVNAIADYRLAVHAHFKNQDEAKSFLKSYPFKFADVVHSGNKNNSITDKESNSRILRNQLGGSMVFSGAVKLMEGYDNPKIEVAFLMRPYRRSNTALIQQFGRALRISNDPTKVALAVQFIWDDRQLLLSSPDILGTMNYGLKSNLSINFSSHMPNTLNYQVATEINKTGFVNKGKKRSLPNQAPGSNKKRKIETSGAISSKKQLLEQLQELFLRIQAKSKLLFQFSIEYPLAHEALGMSDPAMAIDPLVPIRAMTPKDVGHEKESSKLDNDESALSHETEQAIKQLESLLKPQTMSQGYHSSKSSALSSHTQDKEDLKSIKALLKRAQIILKKGERFFVQGQMNVKSSDLQILQEEWQNISETLLELFDGYENTKSEVGLPLSNDLYEAIKKFPAKNYMQLFDRTYMRKYFRDNLWTQYHAKNPQVTGELADDYFAKLIKGLLKELVTESNASELLGMNPSVGGGQYLLQIYKSDIVRNYLRKLYDKYAPRIPLVELPKVKLAQETTVAQVVKPVTNSAIRDSSNSSASNTFLPISNPAMSFGTFHISQDNRKFSECRERMINLIRQKDSLFKLDENVDIVLYDANANRMLEECIRCLKKPLQDGGFSQYTRESSLYISLLAQYVDLLTRYELPLPEFEDYSYLEIVLGYFEQFGYLTPQDSSAHARLKVILNRIGCVKKDLELGAYAAAFRRRSQLDLKTLRFPIFLQTIFTKDSRGKFFFEYIRDAEDHEYPLNLMYLASNETVSQKLIVNFGQIEDTRHYEYFINRAKFSDPLSMKLAIFALTAVREKFRRTSIRPSTPENLGEYIAYMVNNFAQLGPGADYERFLEFYNVAHQIISASYEHTMISAASNLIDWQAVVQLSPEIVEKIVSIFSIQLNKN